MEENNEQAESQPAEAAPDRPERRPRPQARSGEQDTAEGRPERPEPRPVDPRRRLRELLSIPERDRSDAQWDEINELEIQLAPGNRLPGAPPPGGIAPAGGAAKKFRGKPRPAAPDQQQRRPPPRPRKTPPAQS